MENSSILRRLAGSRLAFLKKIERLSEAELTDYPVEGGWTIKDLIAHITSWDLATLSPLQAFLNGDEFVPEEIPDILAWNNAQARIWQTKSLATILDESLEIRQALNEETARLSNEQCRVQVITPWGERKPITEMLRGLARHEEDHSKMIEAWLKKRAR